MNESPSPTVNRATDDHAGTATTSRRKRWGMNADFIAYRQAYRSAVGRGAVNAETWWKKHKRNYGEYNKQP